MSGPPKGIALWSHGDDATWRIDKDGDVEIQLNADLDCLFITSEELKNIISRQLYVTALSDSERKEYFRQELRG